MRIIQYFFVFAVFAAAGLVFIISGHAHAQGSNEISGYVFEETTSMPVVAAEVWYCSSPVPEEFPVCLAQQLGQTDGNGKWVFQNPAQNYYYRIWATKPLGAYSQAYAQLYSGGSVAWVDLRMAGIRATSNITLASPNKGCVPTGQPIDFQWLTTIANIDHFTIGRSDSEFMYDRIAEVPGSSRSYLWTKKTNPGWFRFAVAAHGPQGQFLGQDFSDAQIQIASVCPATALSVNNIRAADITDTSARIIWDTNVPAVSTVEYKISTLARPDGFATAVTSDFITSHATALTYLSPDTLYYYYIRLWDALRNEFRTETLSFMTRAISTPSSVPEAPIAIQEAITTKPATDEIIIEITDGARVIIPPSAALMDGLVTVAIKTAIQPPKESGIEVVGAVYDVGIQDAAKRIVKDLAGEIEIVLPYRDKNISKLGVGENEVFPAYFDEAQERWIKIENYSQDVINNVIIARVSHLTRFAIVAAADITPPAAPTGITVRALDGGGIELLWKNPVRDFHHIKIYRSKQLGALGVIVGNEIFASEFTDHETESDAYYYTVRAVDPAGNESLNRKQYGSRAKGVLFGGADAEEMVRFQNFRVGDSGERVRVVQEVLTDEGLYPAGLIHGSFDEYTKQAVILFQEKYAEDILVPAGLVRGTGVVGLLTWKKMSELRAEKEVLKKKLEEPKKVVRPEEIAAPSAPQPGLFIRWWRAFFRFFGW